MVLCLNEIFYKTNLFINCIIFFIILSNLIYGNLIAIFMTLEKGSLILLDYTAKIKDTNEIFETTRENDVKDSKDFDPSRKYEPRLLGVGEGWVLKGLDDALLNANMDEPFEYRNSS